MQKRILFITGTRADYGKLRSLIENVDRSEEFECHIFATGMHTLARYGSTYDEIRKAGYRNIYLYINQFADNSAAMDMVLANTIQGLAHYVREFPPDLIVVHGDRIEALAGATVGALNNILVAHIEGGELSGTIDELIRHSISKLSHLHFVANQEARIRVIQMGELETSVFAVGSADIDVMLSGNLPAIGDVKRHYEIDFPEYAIFAFHPVTTELEGLRLRMQEVVDSLTESGWNFVVIYPNNDTGADVILETLRPLEQHPRFRLFPSLRFEYFLSLLKHARAIVGNSSAGIREAPVYGVPTVNIGSRQRDRYEYVSIMNVPEDKAAILAALKNLPPQFPPSLHFGGGNCAFGFMEMLRSPRLWETPRQKQFRDVPMDGNTRELPISVAATAQRTPPHTTRSARPGPAASSPGCLSGQAR